MNWPSISAWLSRHLFRVRYAVWLVVLSLVLVSSCFVPPVEFDQTVEGFFPENHPALLSFERSKRSFGGSHLVFVVYDDANLWTVAGMDRVRGLADRIAETVPGVERVDAIDQMPVPWLVDDAVRALASETFSLLRIGRLVAGRASVRILVGAGADDPERIAGVRRKISSHPLFKGLFVNESGGATSLIVRLSSADDTDRRSTVAALRKIADDFAKSERIEHVAVAGSPVLVVDGFASLERDNQRLGLVAMALMAITMFFAVRNPAWALLPLIAGWATWEITRIFITVFQLKLTLSAGPIIAQTVVLCMPGASHLAVRFFANLHQGLDRREAADRTLNVMFSPVAWCAIASSIGYLASWMASTVQPVAQFGMTMFACNLVAGTLVWSLSAGAMTFRIRWKRQPGASVETGTSTVAEGVGRLTGWVLDHPGATLILFVVPMLFATIGAMQLKLESNYISVHKADSRVSRDYRFIENRMGGIGLVELIFPAPAEITTAWLDGLRDTSKHLHESDPDIVSGVVSLADLLSAPADATAEEQADVLTTKIRILSQPAYSNFLNNLWSRHEDQLAEGQPAEDQIRILIRVQEGARPELKEACFAKLVEIARREQSDQAFITGLSHLMTQITHAVVSTAFLATIWSGVLSLGILWVALRDLRLAALAFAPTLLAVGLVLGIMGWLGLKIDMSTALVAGVAIGLSIDDAVHCLLRWEQELRAGHSSLEALKIAYAGTGPGVVLSSSAVSLGFLAMLYSEFVPMSNFGWLVAVATAGGSLGNLVVIPAVLAVATSRTQRSTDRSA